jgi:hypothetical protein
LQIEEKNEKAARKRVDKGNGAAKGPKKVARSKKGAAKHYKTAK